MSAPLLVYKIRARVTRWCQTWTEMRRKNEFHIKPFHSLKRRCVNFKFTLKCWCDAKQTECWNTNGTSEWGNDEWMNWGSIVKCGSFFRLSKFYIFSATTAAFPLLYEIVAFTGYMVCGSFKNGLLPVCVIWVTRPPKVRLFSSDCGKSLPDPRASV